MSQRTYFCPRCSPDYMRWQNKDGSWWHYVRGVGAVPCVASEAAALNAKVAHATAESRTEEQTFR